MPYLLSQKLDSTMRYLNGLYGLSASVLTQIAQAGSDAATALANIAAHIGSTGNTHGAATTGTNGFMTTAQVALLNSTNTNANTALSNASSAQTTANTGVSNAATAQAAATAAQSAVDALLIRVERAQETDAVSALREVFRITGQQLHSFDYSASGFNVGAICAVGDNGTIVYGAAGRTPAAKAPAGTFTGTFADVASNGAYWVAVGSSGQIQASSDGSSWMQAKSTGANFNAVASGTPTGYPSGIWLAVGASGAMFYSTAPNGQSGWTQVTGALGTAELSSVMFEPTTGLWVITSRDGRVQTSTAPWQTWTARLTVSGTSPYFAWRSLQYTARHGFVALYVRNTNQIGFATSPDGINWTTGVSTTVPSTVGSWQNPDGIRFTLLDRSVLVFDAYASPSEAYALVFQTANAQSTPKMLTMLGKLAVRLAKNVVGQLVVVGQANGGDGVMLMSPLFRPSSTSE